MINDSLKTAKHQPDRRDHELHILNADGFGDWQRRAAHTALTPCSHPMSSGAPTVTQKTLYGKSRKRFPQGFCGKSVLAASIVLACLFTTQASAASFVKLKTGASNTGQVNLLTLYPVLAAGDPPYSRFYYTVQTKTQQRVTVRSTVECSKGDQDVTQARTFAFVATPKPFRHGVGVSPPFPDYCSVNLTFTGRGWIKAVLWGAVR